VIHGTINDPVISIRDHIELVLIHPGLALISERHLLIVLGRMGLGSTVINMEGIRVNLIVINRRGIVLCRIELLCIEVLLLLLLVEFISGFE
jgi:hypothetical protein